MRREPQEFFPDTQWKDPSSRAMREKRGSSGCGRAQWVTCQCLLERGLRARSQGPSLEHVQPGLPSAPVLCLIKEEQAVQTPVLPWFSAAFSRWLPSQPSSSTGLRECTDLPSVVLLKTFNSSKFPFKNCLFSTDSNCKCGWEKSPSTFPPSLPSFP